MTVPSSTQVAGPFYGNGVTTSFPFTFKCFDKEHLRFVVATDGVEVEKVLDSDYSVTLNGDQDANPGGSITYPISGSPMASDSTASIEGAVPLGQGVDLPDGGAFNASDVERALDILGLQNVQQQDQINRSLRLPVTAASADAELPPPDANSVIGWDSAGAALRNFSPETFASVVAYSNRRTLVANGGAATYTLAADPGSVHNTMVAVGGVVQTPGVDYTVSGVVLTPTTTWPVGTGNVVIVYGEALPVGTANAGDVEYDPTTAYVDKLGKFLNYTFGRTVAEIAAGVTPTNYYHLPGDVRRYGAVVDASTDDKTAVQAALDCFEQGGAPVYLPGICYVASGLTYDAARGLQMYGDGWNSGLKGANAGTYIILLIQRTGFTAIDGVRLRDFSIDGNNGGQLDAGLLQLNNCTGFVVDHVKVGNTTKVSGSSGVNGITCSAGSPGGTGSKGAIQNSLIYATSKAGINWTSESVQAHIVGNEIRDITGNGTAPGIQVNGGFGARVQGNYINTTEGPGIYVSEDGSANYPLDTIISGNVIKSAGATSTTQGDGIRVTATVSYTGRMVIQGNIISDSGTNTNGGSGIYVINTQNVLIGGNVSRNNRYDGVRVQGCDHVVIAGNRLTGNNLAAASFAGGVQILGTCSHVAILSNHCSDDKSSKTQSYGVILSSGATLDSLTMLDNHLEGNASGPILLNAGAKKMRLEFVAEKQTTDGAAQTFQYITMPDTSALVVTARVIGKQSDASNRAIYTREALFYRNGGSATQQGATTTLGADIESDATWTGPSMTVSGNLAALQITGKAATTIDWRANMSVQTL